MKTKRLIRDVFRNTVFERDNHTCRKCNKKHVNLDAHHITDRNEMPNGGYVKENGISLCSDCHIKAEQYHIGNVVENGFSPTDLYKLICSTYDKAYQSSLKI